jgi:diguanylate cyclase (GGDEF)-like protein/PAS domain S-box-containing protein
MPNIPDSYVFKRLFDLLDDPILLMNERGVVIYVNSSLEQHFGYAHHELIHQPIEQIIPDFLKKISIQSARTPQKPPQTIRAKQKNGIMINTKLNVFSLGKITSELSCQTIDDCQSITAVIVHHQPNHLGLEKKLYYLATHDHLTGLTNASTLERRLKKLMIEATQNNTSLAICMLDLDNFKEINDSYNHQIGDLLLKSFAKRLRQNTRLVDVIARMGGDEFICLISGIKQKCDVNPIVTQLQAILAQPFKIKNKFLEVSASIGVTLFPQDGKVKKKLLLNADEAMYQAKKMGKNTVCFYSKFKEKALVLKNKNMFVEYMDNNYIWNQNEQLTITNHSKDLHNKVQFILQDNADTNLFMLLINIDNFRTINNLVTYDVANVLLNQVLERLTGYCKDHNGVSAHTAADEFIVLIHDCTLNKAKKIAAHVVKIMADSFQADQHELNITASIGVSHYPADAKNAEELFIQANIALYRAKELGKNNYQFFNLKLKGKIHYAQQLQKDLLHVLERQELFLLYQPQYDLNNKQIIGVESLLRWQHPILGCIGPDDFIPLMEHSRQIIPVGDWVLLNACQQAKIWQKTFPELQVAVNVSSVQLRASPGKKNHILHSVQQALEYSGLSPESLELEITESTIVKDDSATKNNLKKLKDLGVHIACDDFGVGYASFGRLKQLPLNTIKIDKSLIKDIGRKPIDFSIVRSIVTIAQQLNIKVIAEGVETLEQLNVLLDLGCTVIQGYMYCKPVKPTKMNVFLKNKKAFP